MNFLDELAFQLMFPELKRRVCNKNLKYDTRELAAEVAGIDMSTLELYSISVVGQPRQSIWLALKILNG